MKVSNPIKKMVVISIFCSQVMTLLPMDQKIRPTRGLSAMSLTSQNTLAEDPVQRNLFNPEETLARDLERDKETRQTRLNTLFYDEQGTNTINIPDQFQDETNPGNLDQTTKIVIDQDADKDAKAVAQQEERKASLAARLSQVDAKIDEPQNKDLEAKLEEANQLTKESKSLLERLKESKGFKYGSALFILTTLAFAAWSTVDIVREKVTLPGAAYIADSALDIALDAAMIVIAFVVKSSQAQLKKLQAEEGIYETAPQSIQTVSLAQRLKGYCSNSFEFVKNKAVHIATSVALADAILTITTILQDNPGSKTFIAAQLISNIQTAFQFIFAGSFVAIKIATNNITKRLALREVNRRKSDGVLHQDTELTTPEDRRNTVKAEDQVEVTMVANELLKIVPTADVTADDSETSTPEKTTPGRVPSVEQSPALQSTTKQLDFDAAELTA